MNKKRLKNYGLWIAVISLVTDVLIYSNVIPVSESQAITGYAQRGLELLVLLGIVSNPTKPDGKGFNL
jgi:uncharacterized membrane protein